MPVVPFIPAIIGGATSAIGGILGSRAANSAASTQSQAATAAAAQVQQAANNAATGVSDATSAGAQRIDAATGQAVGGVQQATQAAQAGAVDASGRAIDAYGAGTTAANQTLATTLAQQQANLQPYQQVGQQGAKTLAEMTAPGGQLLQQFSFDGKDLQNDPGYQFQLQQGQQALERSAAARGAISSGGTLKGMAAFGQGLAGTSFGSAFDRAQKTFTTNREGTLDTLRTLTGIGERATAGSNAALGAYGGQASTNQMNLGRLTGENIAQTGQYVGNVGMAGANAAGQFGMSGANSLAQLTQQGATAVGNYGIRGAEGSANYLTDAARATAAGRVGSANAWTGAISGIGNAAVDAANAANKKGRSPFASTASLPTNRGYDARMFPGMNLSNFTQGGRP